MGWAMPQGAGRGGTLPDRPTVCDPQSLREVGGEKRPTGVHRLLGSSQIDSKSLTARIKVR